ncbi:metal-sulfur cluster assembly factor [Streptomyces phaeolivaceus]|uniref:Metal-sulfur cluster assembly factor n=1 Tax=Streptomyces phaeolivaceus TaxID=2653200 RepID=A0A5P8KEJ0_9ACTN|nr:metal-sulfur cluster assembly factor [Streptomyces phaeolivaceus]QFR01696.1 metal-sulfur cluster assembly factor [Streptomyces phaeolivaceus]
MSCGTDEVRGALRRVADPCAVATGVPVDIVAMGLVQDVRVDSGEVTVELRLTSPFCMQIGLITEQARAVVGELPGVTEVRIEVDHVAEWMPEDMDPEARAALRRVRPLSLTVIS